MPVSIWENTTRVLAVLVLGVMAGFFWTYSINVAPALLQVSGETYAEVQSLLNVNVRHWMFFIFFFGGGALTAVALAVNYRHWRSASFWLLALAGLIYILGIIVFTKQVNLPLNYYTESWNPAALPSDWEQVRASWNSANAWRVASSGVAFVLGLIALVLRK
ncbi:MAG: DUF1772 domain-containing protein [Thiolinea sp.]